MGTRHPNHRLAKIHRSYTVEEVAALFGVHRKTVREWIKRGLPTIDCKRPMLILGRDIAAFLQARRVKSKRTCQPGEIYCVRCRVPRNPAGGMADYLSVTATLGNLIGICPCCDAMMYRRVNRMKLEQVRGKLDITMPQALSHIVGVLSHFSQHRRARLCRVLALARDCCRSLSVSAVDDWLRVLAPRRGRGVPGAAGGCPPRRGARLYVPVTRKVSAEACTDRGGK